MTEKETTETPEEGHCHGGRDGKHTWRFSNSMNVYYCTTPGCRETWNDQA